MCGKRGFEDGFCAVDLRRLKFCRNCGIYFFGDSSEAWGEGSELDWRDEIAGWVVGWIGFEWGCVGAGGFLREASDDV